MAADFTKTEMYETMQKICNISNHELFSQFAGPAI